MSHIIDFITKILPGDWWNYLWLIIPYLIGKFKIEWLKTITEPIAKTVGLFISITILLIPKIPKKTAEKIENGFVGNILEWLAWIFLRIKYWMLSDNITTIKAISNPKKLFSKDAKQKPKYSKSLDYRLK